MKNIWDTEAPPRPPAASPNRWYAAPWATLVLLLFMPPLGVFLMWKYREWSGQAKKIVTAVAVPYFGWALISSNEPKPPASPGEAVAQKAPPRVRNETVAPRPRSTARPTPLPKRSPARAPKREEELAEEQDDGSDDPIPGDDTPKVEKGSRGNVATINIPDLGMRDIGSVDGVLYMIVKAELTDTIGSGPAALRADGIFYIVRLEARNTTKKTHRLNTVAIKLTDELDREFTQSSEGSVALVLVGDQSAQPSSAQVQPGVTKLLSLVYDAPADARGLRLKIPAGTFSLGRDASIAVP